jgi:hypothetical protein
MALGVSRSSRIALVILAILPAGCSLYRYHPVKEVEVEKLAEHDCKKGDRVTTRAELNQVYEDALVLWDGSDPHTAFTVEFKGPGIARKTKSVVGKDRYERAYDALRDVRAAQQPVEVTLECRGERKTPIATRFSYRDKGGEEIAYEF